MPLGVLRLLLGMPDDEWEGIYETQHDFLVIFSAFPLEPAQQVVSTTPPPAGSPAAVARSEV